MDRRGKATLICWICKHEVEGVVGQISPVKYELTEEWFFPEKEFVCPECEAVDDFAYLEFFEEV